MILEIKDSHSDESYDHSLNFGFGGFLRNVGSHLSDCGRYIPDDHNVEIVFLVSSLFKYSLSSNIPLCQQIFNKLHITFRKSGKFYAITTAFQHECQPNYSIT